MAIASSPPIQTRRARQSLHPRLSLSRRQARTLPRHLDNSGNRHPSPLPLQGRDDRLPADGRIYSRRAAAWPLKRATVVRSLVVFCISIAVVGVASAEPSATPSQIISHI